MKYSILLNSICILLNLVNASSIKKEDDNYLIYVNNTYGVVSDNVHQKRQESQQYIASVMEEIQNIIIENKDTYKNPEELKVFEKRQTNLRKRNNNSKVSYVNEISSVDDITVLSAYLSNEVKEKVNSIPSILGSEPRKKLNLWSSKNKIITMDDIKEKRELPNNNKKINKNILREIKLETGWNDVEYDVDAPLHLSLLSQGYFNGTSTQYDSNFYYPKTAGQDIDVYIIDSSFDFRTSEFSNKDERTSKCLGYLVIGTLEKPDAEDYCEYLAFNCETSDDNCESNFLHGKEISISIGGLTQGAAKKANIYGIVLAMDGQDGEEFDDESLLLGLDYLLNNIPMRPHKSVINISLGDFYNVQDTRFLDYMTKIFNKFSENGVIVVSAAGNNGEPVYNVEEDKISLPCALDSVVCVGAIDNVGYFNPNGVFDFTGKMHPENYSRGVFSNYGNEVNIYASGFIIFNGEYVSEVYRNKKLIGAGTSISSPIVAGVVASIMGEHPEIQFDTQSMISYLTNNGEKDIIENIPEGPNVFINNGKHSVYFKDDIENNTIDDSTPTDIISTIDDSTPTDINDIIDDASLAEDITESIDFEIDSESDIDENYN